MIEDIDLEFSTSFHGVNAIFQCECGEKVQAMYNFEEISPSQIFWEDYGEQS